MGRTSPTCRTVYMLDFGLARQYTNAAGEIRQVRSDWNPFDPCHAPTTYILLFASVVYMWHGVATLFTKCDVQKDVLVLKQGWQYTVSQSTKWLYVLKIWGAWPPRPTWLRLYVLVLKQGWWTCSLREHLIWPTSEFLLHKLEHNTATKRNPMISRYVACKSRKVSLVKNSSLT